MYLLANKLMMMMMMSHFKPILSLPNSDGYCFNYRRT